MANRKSLMIIPCGGNSSRFNQDGRPKAATVIELPGRPAARMVDYVAQFRTQQLHADENVAIVCKREHSEILQDAYPIDSTRGQAETVAQFLRGQHLDLVEDQSFLVVNSDNYFHFDLEIFAKQCEGFSAGALVFHVNKDYSYGYVDSFPVFEKAVEKKMVTPFALAGAFWFSSAKEFNKAFEKQFHANGKVNNEFYISSLFEYLEGDKLAVLITENEFEHWTAPHDITRMGGQICT